MARKARKSDISQAELDKWAAEMTNWKPQQSYSGPDAAEEIVTDLYSRIEARS